MRNGIRFCVVALAACCAGIIVGWFVHSGLVSRGTSMEHPGNLPLSRHCEVSRSNPDTGLLREYARNDEEEQNESPDQSSGGILAADNEDEQEERTERMGIIMQQSAAEVRQAIIDNAGLDDAQIEQLDNAIADMNRQMLEVSTKWAELIRETGTLDMDMRLRMQHDINGVSVAFSDLMDAEFPGWRGDGKDTDLTRLVRVTTAFEPFRKIRSEILRGEVGMKTTEDTENAEGDN